ncbi:MAG: glycosyltransferase family 4 protein [Chloroflexota bacterium]
MAGTLTLSLITLGDPAKVTGGYLYHQRMAAAAPRHGARIDFVSVPERPFPLPLSAGWSAMRAAQGGPASARGRVDAILVDSIAAAYVAAPAVARQSLPLCAIVHQPPGGIDHGPFRSRLQAALDMLLYRRVARVIAASQMLAEELHAWGVPAERLRVVPPGRDVAEHTAPGPPPADPRRGRAVAFLCVANWLPRKGIHLLLDAFATLPPEAGMLHLVGRTDVNPTYARRLHRRLAAPDLTGRVEVHGRLPLAVVAAFYAAADAFVLPSTKEPYGTVYGEAMAAGLPVVGLKAGNLPHLVLPGVEGLLVMPGDARGLAQAMLRLASDEPLRRKMAESARRRAQRWPTWEESAATLFATVREVAG